MGERSVGVRELKDRLSAYLREVKRGQTIVITERGRPIGRIVPEGISLDEKLKVLVDAGLAEWNGQHPPKGEPVARLRGKKTVADLLIEDRR
ncbi:MAG: hypothetical protein A2Z37_13020 [Chloroflexi bacterium RBG_19FT_COMBO_62_14]|nr:MAG: hypothetical protein A2Z37_13020 [Chloroflexi bacterium RBG_19FT_COMBO_62_14]